MPPPTKNSRIQTWLNNIPIEDSVNRQMAALLQVILLGFIAIIVIATILNLLFSPTAIPWNEVVIRSLIISIIIGIPFYLLRRGSFGSSVFIIIALFLMLETFAVLSANLRSIAESLTFFTLAIVLAGLLVGRRALTFTLVISAGAVLLGTLRESDPALRRDSLAIAANFILLNGLMALFLARFGQTFRQTLTESLQRETELRNEIKSRKQTEIALQQSSERLEIMYEIDRALISAQSPYQIAREALIRIRRLIPSMRASATLFDFINQEASFLAADFDEIETIPNTPIPLAEYGLNVIAVLQENKPWLTENMLKESEVTDLDIRLVEHGGIHAWLSLPLFYQGQLIGALNLGRGRGESFNAAEAETAQEVANQLAIALQQTRLYEALQIELIERKKLISELEASNAELERFTYTVSHDLRNPLVTIKGFLGMLNKDLQENRQDRVQTDFQRIAGAADKMDELLTDLLELSRIGRIANPPEEIDLVKLTHEALEMVDARIRAKNVTVTVSPDLPVVYGDRVRLREVFENLITNAAKYSGDRSDPVIEIGVRQNGKDQVIFVKDNGIGIEEQYQTRIFALFEKLNPTIEGTGIGLALVKRIIETHAGKVWVESEGLGKGTTFCFTIPTSR
jgi:signal transduction histidine kinase